MPKGNSRRTRRLASSHVGQGNLGGAGHDPLMDLGQGPRLTVGPLLACGMPSPLPKRRKIDNGDSAPHGTVSMISRARRSRDGKAELGWCASFPIFGNVGDIASAEETGQQEKIIAHLLEKQPPTRGLNERDRELVFPDRDGSDTPDDKRAMRREPVTRAGSGVCLAAVNADVREIRCAPNACSSGCNLFVIGHHAYAVGPSPCALISSHGRTWLHFRSGAPSSLGGEAGAIDRNRFDALSELYCLFTSQLELVVHSAANSLGVSNASFSSSETLAVKEACEIGLLLLEGIRLKFWPEHDPQFRETSYAEAARVIRIMVSPQNYYGVITPHGHGDVIRVVSSCREQFSALLNCLEEREWELSIDDFKTGRKSAKWDY
ncbi:hypothetical protein PCL_03004 [Purpureocillium lilacinum]|uniref:Uncharacterized protein n=1 Tax=Purpureocillium lilacinum TaxID=33203 RepID=A0A2U3DNV4_PURLI|nr:hypothetical protein PCL_03004 [Purpureocillium lilacinum]